MGGFQQLAWFFLWISFWKFPYFSFLFVHTHNMVEYDEESKENVEWKDEQMTGTALANIFICAFKTIKRTANSEMNLTIIQFLIHKDWIEWWS